jgi:hydroxymethylglutaryl-CoA synthase
VSAAAYVPRRRLHSGEVAAFLAGAPWTVDGGGSSGPGQRRERTRAVAGADEDTTTMAVEAARLARWAAPAALAGPAAVSDLRFATTTPTHVDKTNAAVVHAALRLDERTGAFDAGGGLRSGIGVLLHALEGRHRQLVVVADRRDGLPGADDEVAAGDAAAAVFVADDHPDVPVLAELAGTASVTVELLDRWRVPGDVRARTWEERFAESALVPLATRTATEALADADLGDRRPDQLVVTGMHQRVVTATTRALTSQWELAADTVSDAYAERIGRTGCAHPLLAVADLLETARTRPPGAVLVVVHVADGVDALVFRTTPALGRWQPALTVSDQVADGARLPYAKFLAWRGMVRPEPPRRPTPPRVSAPAAARRRSWKYGFVGARQGPNGPIRLPPVPDGLGALGAGEPAPVPMADAVGTIATYTVDTMVPTPDPPVVFALVDFDRGGRCPMELTDVDVDSLAEGQEVEPTFRLLGSNDGIPNYFWKARPRRRGLAVRRDPS